MSAHPGLSVSPLSWVKGEIDLSLGLVRENLALADNRIAGPHALEVCETHLKQVRGALSMLGLDGVTRYCEALEQTVLRRGTESKRLDSA